MRIAKRWSAIGLATVISAAIALASQSAEAAQPDRLEAAPTVSTARTIQPVERCYFNFKWTKTTLTYSYGGQHRYLGNVIQGVRNWNVAEPGVRLVAAPAGQRGDIEFVDYNRVDGHFGGAVIPDRWQADPKDRGYALNHVPVNPYKPTRIKIELNQAYLDLDPGELSRNLARLSGQLGELGDKYEKLFRPPHRYDLDPNFKNFFRTYTATHELGHALGLAHPEDCRGSSSFDSLMHRSPGPSILTVNRPMFDTPLPFDVAEMRTLYAQ